LCQLLAGTSSSGAINLSVIGEMRYTIFISLVIQALLLSFWGCTESATQWEHQQEMQQQCRDTAVTEQDRIDCGRN
jgi:hypothetical protein